MKKILPVFIALFLLLAFSSSPVFSQVKNQSGVANSSSGISMPIPPINDQPFPLGQSHYYTLTLRGNGETLVSLKTIFINRDEASVSAIKVTFPATPRDVSVFQVLRDPQCVRYGYQPPDISYEKDLTVSSYRRPIPTPAPCEEYRDPDFISWGNNTYRKAGFSLKNKELTIRLPKEVKANGSGSYILTYRSNEIAQKNIFGAYKYNFETLKVNDKIQNLVVGINTDPDYYLKDAKGDINYETRQSPVAGALPLSMDSKGVLVNAQFDNYYMQIGQGIIVKNASNLQSNESFTVKGMYADNKFKFYGKEILLSVTGFLLLLSLAIAGSYLSVRWLLLKINPGIVRKAEAKTQEVAPSPATKRLDKFTLVTILVVSFSSSLFVMLYTILLFGLSYYFHIFQYYSYNMLYPLLMILTLIISFCIYVVFLFAPGIFIGMKKGFLAGLATVASTAFWLLIYGIIVGIFFYFFQQPPSPTPYAMDYGVSGVLKSPEAAVGSTETVTPLRVEIPLKK